MRTFSSILALALALSPANALCALGKNTKTHAAQRVSAEQLVRDSATALSKLHSYDLSIITKRSVDDGHYNRTFQNYLDTAFERAGKVQRIRMESREPQDSVTIVSDGNGYWIYHERNRRYAFNPGNLPPEVFRSPTPGFSDALSAENLPTSMESAKIIRQENVPLSDRQELCDVVLVKIKPGATPADYQVKDNELTLWLSHSNDVPMKVSGTFLHKEKDGRSQAMQMAIIVQKFHANAPLPPDTWRFVAPPESQPEPGTPVAASK